MSNFKFLLSEPGFASFADVAIAAEKILHIDPAACILNCRRAMEFAVKWMYSVDKELEMPYQDNLQSLMTREEFRQIVGNDLWQRMDFIRKKGNTAAHNTGKITEAVAMLCLENLHIFLDFVAYCYAEEYTEAKFDPALVPTGERIATAPVEPRNDSIDLAELIEENKKLKESEELSNYAKCILENKKLEEDLELSEKYCVEYEQEIQELKRQLAEKEEQAKLLIDNLNKEQIQKLEEKYGKENVKEMLQNIGE